MKKIELEVSEENEGTAYPYWMILDRGRTGTVRSVDYLAGMITGPFFSRAEAQNHLNATKYNFSKNAIVYCLSGHQSAQYRFAMDDKAKKEANAIKAGERVTTPEGHKARHIELHLKLDELLADFIGQEPTYRVSDLTVLALMNWSRRQCEIPTMRKGAEVSEEMKAAPGMRPEGQ